MSKELTEQWKNRSLKSGTYYIRVKYGCDLIDVFDYYNDENNEWDFHRDIRDVLGAVPSYDEYKRLQEQLAIAIKALKEYEDKQNWDIRGVAFMKYNKGFTIARKALKEMEGVK